VAEADDKDVPIGSLVRIHVRSVNSYLGIVLERVFHDKAGSISYTVYIMDLDTQILMFPYELEVLSGKQEST